MSQALTAVLFPGQGSQAIGMGAAFHETSSEAREIMALAERCTNLPLGELCHAGPMEALTRSENLQPALTVTNLICWQAAKAAGVKADFFAGHSLGEYSALAAAGVLEFEAALKFVALRGRVMGREGEKHPGGMRAVLGLTLPQVQAIVDQVAMPQALSIGNHNSEQQAVLSGTLSALDRASELALAAQAKVVPLAVSIANHSPLMAGALPDIEAAMREARFQRPATPVLFNVTASAVSEPDEIRSTMARQVVSMVRWHEIVNNLYAAGVRNFVEVGPGKVLTGLLKRILPKEAVVQALRVDSPETLAQTLASLG